MNADSFEGVIRKAYPVPEEVYPRAKWMGEAADACGILSKLYRREESALTLSIRTQELESDTYELVGVYRPYSWVNMPLLREKEPEVFRDCVHVKQAFAEKTLGRRRLYEMVADALGDGVKEHETVSVSDVRKMLPAGLAALYIQEGDEFVKYAVVER